MDGQVPDDDQVGNAGNGVPSPLLGGALSAVSGEETGQDHDEIGNDGHEDLSAVETREQAEVDKQERCGDAPVDVAGPVDLAVDGGLCVWDVVVLLGDWDLVEVDAITGGHGEVGDGCGHDDKCRNDVVEALGLKVGVSNVTQRWQLVGCYVRLARSMPSR